MFNLSFRAEADALVARQTQEEEVEQARQTRLRYTLCWSMVAMGNVFP